MPAATHRVENLPDDRVVIRDLELFVGFDKRIDDPKNKRMKKFDSDRIEAVVETTRTFMGRGQNPKLILGHNSDHPDDNAPAKPCVGDIVKVNMREIDGVSGIVGDVEMTRYDFEMYLKTNQFPRRSAEIWPNNLLSEVALLGSETPARPLRDTKFSAAECVGISGGPELFSRRYATDEDDPMAEKNMHPHPKKSMDDDDDKDKMAARIAEQDAEIATLKAKLMEDDEHDCEKTKARRTLERENRDLNRRLTDQDDRLEAVESELKRERFGRQIDEMVSEGYTINDPDEILERIAAAEDPDKEIAHYRKILQRVPIGQRIDQKHLRLAQGNKEQFVPQEVQKDAHRRATTRCSQEGLTGPEFHAKAKEYYEEELAAG